MTVLSGITGQIVLAGSVVASTKRWSVSTKNAAVSSVVSNSSGMTIRNEGPSDFSGSFEGLGLSTLGFLVPGTAYTFLGQTDTDEFKAGIMCSQVMIDCDIASGRPISWRADFEAFGSSTSAGSDNTLFTLQAKTSTADSTDPQVFGSIEHGAKAHWNPLTGGALAGDAEIIDVLRWSLTLRCALKAFVTSSNGGVTKRRAGPKDASASLSVLRSNLAALAASATILTPKQYGVLGLYVNATDAWELAYCISEGLDVRNDHENGDPDEATVNFGYTGWATVSGALTKGSITDPNSVAFFS